MLIKTINILLLYSHHCECFSWSCLAIGKASDLGACKDVWDNWLKNFFKYIFVVFVFTKNLVKNKLMSFCKFCKIYFLFSFQNMYSVFAENFYHVFLACLDFLGVKRAFSYYNLNFAVHYKFNEFIRVLKIDCKKGID